MSVKSQKTNVAKNKASAIKAKKPLMTELQQMTKALPQRMQS